MLNNSNGWVIDQIEATVAVSGGGALAWAGASTAAVSVSLNGLSGGVSPAGALAELGALYQSAANSYQNQSSYTAWTRYSYYAYRELASTCVYTAIPTSGTIGSSGTNYNQTQYGYLCPCQLAGTDFPVVRVARSAKLTPANTACTTLPPGTTEMRLAEGAGGGNERPCSPARCGRKLSQDACRRWSKSNLTLSA